MRGPDRHDGDPEGAGGRLIALAALCVALLAGAALADERELRLESVEKRISDPALPLDQRVDAVYELASAGSRSAVTVSRLIRLVESGHPELRFAALSALAGLGPLPPRPGERMLIDALESPDGDLRFCAAEVFTRLGVTTERAALKLCRLLTDPDHRIRQRAAETLATVPVSHEVLVHSLTCALGDVRESVRRSAAAALIAQGPGALSTVADALDVLGPSGRVYAIHVLGEQWSWGRQHAGTIVASLDREDLAQWVEAAETLEDSYAPSRLRTIAKARVRELTPKVRVREREPTRKTRDRPRRRKRLGGPPGVLATVVLMATIFSDPAAVEVCLALHRAETGREELRALLDRILEANGGIGPLVAAFETGPPPVRRVAVRALGRVRDPAVLRPLHRALADDDEGIRREARSALDRILGVR